MVTYFLSWILIRTISRYREYAADRGSALITGAPEYLMSALQKISSQMTLIPQRDLREVEGMNAFFIIPASVKKASNELFMDAPAAGEAPGRARRDRARDGPPGRRSRGRGAPRRSLRAKKLKDPARERLFAISTARITLETELDLKPAGVGGRLLQVALGRRVRARRERAPAAARRGRRESGSKIERQTDELGFEWLVVRDGDFEDLVTTVHLVAQELQARGFGAPAARRGLPASRARARRGASYWIYGFKRGAFWPFVPTGEDKERDNAEELELKAKLEQELPIEPDLIALVRALRRAGLTRSRHDSAARWAVRFRRHGRFTGKFRESRVEMREEFRALRAEMREGFQDLRDEMRGLRSETKDELRGCAAVNSSLRP